MKKPLTIFAFIFCLFASLTFGQEKTEWTRIESANKEVSVSMPSEFLVDAVKKDFDNQSLRIISFQNGVQVEFLIYDEKNPQKYLQQLKTDGESKTIGFGDDSFNLKRIPGNVAENSFSDTIFLASKKYLYCFYVRAENADKPEVSQFFYSIKANGKSIFTNKNQEKNIDKKSISAIQLKTSPEILTALNQPFENSERKINYEFKKIKPDQSAEDFSIRPSVILVSPYPTGASLAVKPAFGASYVGQNSGAATIKLKLLAKGQLGDVIIYSISDRRILYEFMEGIKRIRFLPAMRDGKSVDSELSIEFDFPYY